jgi:hypothetical protein
VEGGGEFYALHGRLPAFVRSLPEGEGRQQNLHRDLTSVGPVTAGNSVVGHSQQRVGQSIQAGVLFCPTSPLNVTPRFTKSSAEAEFSTGATAIGLVLAAESRSGLTFNEGTPLTFAGVLGLLAVVVWTPFAIFGHCPADAPAELTP